MGICGCFTMHVTEAVYMTDSYNFVLLVCAAVGSMAFGVLAAYGIFKMVFAAMRPRQEALPVKARPEIAL